MNIFVNRILGFGLLTVMAGGLQAAQQAKFHLPFSATWANVVLPPGDYTVLLPEIGAVNRQFVLQSEGKTSFLSVLTTDQRYGEYKTSDRSSLNLVNINGTYYVQSYESGPSSREFSFRVPKPGVKVQYGKREAVKLDVAGE